MGVKIMQSITEIQTTRMPHGVESKENGEENEGIKIHRWTQDEYYKMAELGFFHNKRVELIEGEIIEIAPMKSSHATSVSLAGEILRERFDKNFYVRSQLPLSFSKINEPEPDVAIVRGTIRDFSVAHPKTAELVVEISDATLRYDRTEKMNLYAKNKIPDYWIVNIKNRCVEIYRRPIQDKKLGFDYTEINIFTEKDTVSPLAAPEVKVKVKDLLP